LVVIVVVVVGVLCWRHSRNYVFSDDAFIDVVSERASPQISGRVLRVLVDDNQDVTAGQVLFELDPADYAAKLDQARASRAQAQAQVAQATAQSATFAAQMEQAEANQGVAEANATNAGNDLKRYENLRRVNPGAVSPQQFDSAWAAARSGAAQERAAEQSVTAARAQLGYVKAEIEAAQAGVRSAESQIHQADLTLSYAQVKARVAGRVAGKTVSEGNYVMAGAEVMAIVPRDVYITANFKETQLARMRPGQAVKVKIDAYPDMDLRAHLDSVEPATGQAFSLLPAENATGNWVKVVQRVPVKIIFDQIPDDPARRLGPGMSVEVTVMVR
jgi:membrane fusion protein (multidrug efflux system)